MLTRIFPFLAWFKGYSMESLRTDAISGLTVALVLIPQSMAYAQLAGLPPYYGLYASFLPPMIASLFGSSRQLATGPVAIVSLMTSASLEPLATAGSDGFIAYAILLALTVGVFQLALGLLRLGLVVNFLSHPVVNGFTNAAAIIIASSQLSKLFGVTVDNADHHYETIIRVIEGAIHYTHWPTFLMGLLAFVIMYVLRRISPKIPNVLIAVVVTTIISWAIGFEHNATTMLSQIDHPEIEELVHSFNEAVGALPIQAEKRTELNQRLEKAEKENRVRDQIDIEHELALVDAEIELLKEESYLYRTRLRRLLFTGIEDPQTGKLRFVRKTEGGEEGDGRTWKIKVGTKAIDTDALFLMGGGRVVGEIPKGLPAFSFPKINFGIFLQLFPYAAIISLLGFMEAISIAKAMAAKTGQRLDPNRELVGQGLANILGSFSRSYPCSGSFSRSAVNLQAGALTGFSSVFTSVTVIIVLIFLTPLLYHLPQAVLAAVIMMAVIGLVNVSGFIHAWKAQWYDGAISIISFIATLVFAPHLHMGIMIGVVLSLIVFLYKSMRPTVVSLSRSEDQAFKSSFTHQLAECKYVDLVRFDGPLFFANASYLEDQINDRLMQKKGLKDIVIVANGISDMDASGEEVLSLLIDRVRSAGAEISLSGVNEVVMLALKRTHLLEKIGEDHIYPTMEHAVCGVQEHAHRGGTEKDCPLTTVCRLSINDPAGPDAGMLGR
jgi:MFS superfamily sulfate permease-like transporter